MCNFLSGVITREKEPRILCGSLLHHERTVAAFLLKPEQYREWEWTNDDDGKSLVVRAAPGENPNVLKSAILAKFPTRRTCLAYCIQLLQTLENADVSESPVTVFVSENAKTIDARGCTALTELKAENAKTIDASGCTALTELKAENAETIYARGCTALTELKAENAKTICASGCTALKK